MKRINKTAQIIQDRKNMIDNALAEAELHFNNYNDYPGALANYKNNLKQCSLLIYPVLSSPPETELKEGHQKIVTKFFEYFDKWTENINGRGGVNSNNIEEKEKTKYNEYLGYVKELKQEFPDYIKSQDKNVAALNSGQSNIRSANRNNNQPREDIAQESQVIGGNEQQLAADSVIVPQNDRNNASRQRIDRNEVVLSDELYHDNQQGLEALEQGNYDKAVEQFTKVLASDAIDEEHQHAIESNLAKAEAWQKIEFYEDILKHGKTPYTKQMLANSYNELGIVLNKQGMYKEAEKQYKEALTYCSKENKHIIESNITNVYNQWGVDLNQQGKYKEAIKKYKKALKTCPQKYESIIKGNIADSYNRNGLALHEKGNYTEAAINYRKARSYCPKSNANLHTALNSNLRAATNKQPLQSYDTYQASQATTLQIGNLQIPLQKGATVSLPKGSINKNTDLKPLPTPPVRKGRKNQRGNPGYPGTR